MHHRHTSRRRASMAGGLIATLATAALVAATIQAAPGQAAAPASSDNRHVLQDSGRALSAHTGKSDLSTVKHFLRTKGANARTLRSLRPAGAAWTYRGVTHQRYEQRVSGLRVYGAEAKAAVQRQGPAGPPREVHQPGQQDHPAGQQERSSRAAGHRQGPLPRPHDRHPPDRPEGHDDHVRQGPLLPGATQRRAGRRTDQGRRVQGRLRGHHLGRAQQQAVLDAGQWQGPSGLPRAAHRERLLQRVHRGPRRRPRRPSSRARATATTQSPVGWLFSQTPDLDQHHRQQRARLPRRRVGQQARRGRRPDHAGATS